MEELRGPEHHGRQTGFGEFGGERVARGVGAAHPGEDHGATREEAAQPPERFLLVVEPRGGSPERLGLPGDLGGERVRKLS